MIHIRSKLMAASVVVLCSAGWSMAAGTPPQKCESGKNDLAGKYLACLGKAQKAFVVDADPVAYASAVVKCEFKLGIKWTKLESAAAAAGDACPTSSDQVPMQSFMDGCSTAIAAALAGGDIPLDPATCTADLETCTGDLGDCSTDLSTCSGDLASTQDDLDDCETDLAACIDAADGGLTRTGQTVCYDTSGAVVPCAGTGLDGESQAGNSPFFVDNGDGTITDYNSGLMWEKLSDDGSIHDKDTSYANVQAAIGKASTLNSMNFAGHNDWRIPNARELASFFNYSTQNPAVFPVFHTGCTPGCTVLTCSCTRPDVIASSTIYLPVPSATYRFNCYDGDMYAAYMTDPVRARAVRTAS